MYHENSIPISWKLAQEVSHRIPAKAYKMQPQKYIEYFED